MAESAPQIQVETSLEGSTGYLRVAGDVDAATSSILESKVRSLLDAGARDLVFDCSRVAFIDSTGLRVVIAAEQLAHRNTGLATVRRPSDSVRKIMEITGVATMISDL